MAVAAAAAAGPVFWRRLLGLLPGRPGLAALLGRLSDRLGRNRDRQRRSCSPGHLPTLLPVSRRRAPVPVDQKPGSRIWSLQFSH
ncbi:PGS1 isoform 7 [Pan troglodytes]|uniref:PGS1 isoform 7 n=1 Tax=Pan troglodytes TaxID=9598 RepID=A0A2J8K7W5_PANTR|nr:PGS1 isoform 7 [Pan troglodytes]